MNSPSLSAPSRPPVRTRWLHGVLLVVFGIVVFLLLSMLLDRALGLFLKQPAESDTRPAGLIFPPNTSVRHVSSEFAHTININSSGIRGPELQPANGQSVRIALLGDSFVYGWGVNDDEAIPAVLERNLRQIGVQADVINLGAPGESPFGYANIADKTLPVIKPDLVVVAVLQGEDYGQLWWQTQTPAERRARFSAKELLPRLLSKITQKTLGIRQKLYPNTTRMLSPEAGVGGHLPAETAADLQASMRKEARTLEKRFNRTDQQRFERLPRTIKDAFRDGKLNAVLVYYALKEPRYLMLTTEWNTARGSVVVSQMAREFERIKAAADRVGAQAIVVSIPYGPYVSAIQHERFQRFGFVLKPGLLTSSGPDDAIKHAARRAGLPFYNVTSSFREEAACAANSCPPLYYEYDGHFTREGNRTYSRLLAPIVAERAQQTRP